MADEFKDHFSAGSDDYSIYRPHYPDALFEHLASITSGKKRAWDCATGNGQAAVPLASHFEEVYATDASENQIENAAHADNLVYRTAPAEDSALPDDSMDLVTVAQALHWFDIDAFAKEADRVLKKGGILAVWAYALHKITPEIDECINDFYENVVAEFWPPERKMVENGYRDIELPFKQLESPTFEMKQDWAMFKLVGYLDTWSAVSAYKKQHGTDPIDSILGKLTLLWGNPVEPKPVIWPLPVKIGIK